LPEAKGIVSLAENGRGSKRKATMHFVPYNGKIEESLSAFSSKHAVRECEADDA
jgi:hypothetical protein